MKQTKEEMYTKALMKKVVAIAPYIEIGKNSLCHESCVIEDISTRYEKTVLNRLMADGRIRRMEKNIKRYGYCGNGLTTEKEMYIFKEFLHNRMNELNSRNY